MTRSPRVGLLALLSAEAVSSVGTRMSQIAIPWLVFTETGSTVRTGLVGLAAVLPFVVFKILGAPVVDRIGGHRVSVFGNVGAAIALAAVPILMAVDHLGLGSLLGCVFVAGLLRGPADSANTVLLPAVAMRAGTPLDRAVAALDGAERTAGLIGAPAGAALIGLVGAPWVVAIDAASFGVAALLVALLVPREAGTTTSSSEPPSGYLLSLREGLRYLAGHRLLRAIAGMVLFTNLVDAALSGLLLIVWAQERYGSATPVGLVGAALGLGAVAGATLMVAVGHRVPRRWTFTVAFLIAGAPRFVVLALSLPLGVVISVWAVSGFAAGMINPLLGAAQYDATPRRLQARVLSAVGGVAWAGIPFGALSPGSSSTRRASPPRW